LEAHSNAFCAFGLGSPDRVLLLPFSLLAQHLEGMFTSPDKGGDILHWHVRFAKVGDGMALLVERDRKRLDVTEYLLKK
jgi:hypothetical protein